MVDGFAKILRRSIEAVLSECRPIWPTRGIASRLIDADKGKYFEGRMDPTTTLHRIGPAVGRELRMNSELIIERDGTTAVITLNRPEKRNALNENLILGLTRGFSEIDSDRSVRAIILRGAGTDFCSGADLSALRKIAESDVIENLYDAEQLMHLFAAIRRVRVPVIAAVHGRALAGGCGLATACDIVLAARSARFGYPEVRIGFVPAMVMAILRRNVSEKRAFELIARGFDFSADEAERFGLVTRVLEDEGFDGSVSEYASAFGKLSASAVALSKKLLYQMDAMPFGKALETGAEVNAIARMTEDCRRGIERFLDGKK